MTDTYQLTDANPQRELVWRIILGVFSVLMICVTAYTMNLVITKKASKAYLPALWGASAGAVIAVSFGYLGLQGLLLTLFTCSRNFLIGSLFAQGYDWYRKIAKQKELEKQNVQSELSLLKNQINPHFLFNTLNNIDSLIKSNPPKASKTLVQLSDMMRYMIYDTNTDTIPLKQELNYIENYLKLQNLQYPNDKLVDYTVTGDIDNIRIAPMLFIPFIENAFKHCTDKEKENAIRLSFEIINRTIIFTSVNISDKEQVISKDKSSGVGLEIVKRRLELRYPQMHTLVIKEENNLFCISLKIKADD